MKKTRTILIKENSENILELQVNPISITINNIRNNINENVDELGDVYFLGKRGLKSVSISTFLPGDRSRFRRSGTQSNDLKLLDRWINENVNLRFVISKPSQNFKVALDSVDITTKEGDSDVYVDLKLTEVKDIAVESVESAVSIIKNESTETREVELKERSTEEAPQSGDGKIEIVNSKTTLWGLAKKYYQDGEKWKRISEANGNIDPKKLKEGTKLVIP